MVEQDREREGSVGEKGGKREEGKDERERKRAEKRQGERKSKQ